MIAITLLLLTYNMAMDTEEETNGLKTISRKFNRIRDECSCHLQSPEIHLSSCKYSDSALFTKSIL